MNDKATKNDRDKNFNEKGKFIKGNIIGRMPKKGFNLSDLNKLVREYEEAEGKKKGKKKDSLLKHYIKRLFKNDRLLEKYMNKNIPTKSINELTGPGGEPLSITLREIIYGKDEKKEKKGKKEKSGDPEIPVK